jgi:hypothetical protein
MSIATILAIAQKPATQFLLIGQQLVAQIPWRLQ